MGFYVNLEMPKDCPMCPFAHYDSFDTFRGCDITRGKRWAVTNDKDYAESSTRPDWCPLVEVPEPHGRLGDLDAIEKQIDYIANLDWNKQVGASGGMLAALEVVEDASTIIQASEVSET